ncbi:sulfurtransferase TusA family protein [Desulfitobacterium sp. Sab5]|uniref:sulfurtransferase TusA family protein n=1 Tax=Desulfitobacterium TaxID=36853 RepID=UPI003CFB5A3A
MSIKPDDSIDITNVVCPITFVKVKVAMEELETGEILEIRMNSGEPIQNVPRSLTEENHIILGVINNQDETYTVYVEKGED